MADFRENIQAEIENINNVLSCFPPASALPDLSQLELAGVSTFLRQFASHGYALDLDPAKLSTLVEELDSVFIRFKSDVAISLK